MRIDKCMGCGQHINIASDHAKGCRVDTKVKDSVSEQASKDYQALDRIAKLVSLDDSGSWTDMSGLLERIGYAVMSTGRKVEGWE